MKEFLLDNTSEVSELPFLGEKARNFYLMELNGLNIPNWFCLSSKLSEKGLSSEIENSISDKLEAEKFYAIKPSFNNNADNIHLPSFLNIPSSNILEKIKLCYENFSAKKSPNLSMGIIIQEMIPAKCSGVLFTANPNNNENFLDEISIQARFGISDGSELYQVENDEFIFSKKQKKVVSSQHGIKKKQIILKTSEGIELVDLDPSKENISVLTNSEINTLVSNALQIRDFYHLEQRLEWCIDESGKIYITQSKEFKEVSKGANTLDYYLDNSKVIKSFVGVNTPWTLAQVRDIYSIAFKKVFLRLGVSRNKVNLNYYTFQNLLGMYKGRIYYNLSNFIHVIELVPFASKFTDMERVRSTSLAPQVKSSGALTKPLDILEALIISMRLFYICLILDISLKRLDKRYKVLFSEYWQDESRGDYLQFTPAAAIKRLERFKAELFKNADLTLINDLFFNLFKKQVKKIIAKKTILDVNQTIRNLFLDIRGTYQKDIDKSLFNLKQQIDQNTQLKKEVEILVNENNFNLLYLHKNSDYREFVVQFKKHIETFGDCDEKELKIETVTYRENHQLLAKKILDFNYEDQSEENLKITKETQAEMKKSLKTNPLALYLYLTFYKLARRSCRYREMFLLHRSKAYGVVRRMSINIGKKLEAIGDIEKYDDIFYLEKSDLYNHYTGQTFSYDLKSIAKTNKALFTEYLELNPKSTYTIRQGVFKEVD